MSQGYIRPCAMANEWCELHWNSTEGGAGNHHVQESRRPHDPTTSQREGCLRPHGSESHQKGAPFCHTPDVEVPDFPQVTIDQLQDQAALLGHARNKAHMVKYDWSTVLPDTPMCRNYVSWFTSRCPCLQYGIILMNMDSFLQNWSVELVLDIEHDIFDCGRPPLVWNLITYIDDGEDCSYDNADKSIQPWFRPTTGETPEAIGSIAIIRDRHTPRCSHSLRMGNGIDNYIDPSTDDVLEEDTYPLEHNVAD